MRTILATAALVASLAGTSSAFAQSTYVHHNFCLKSGASTECAYETMAQCEASKRENTDVCIQNSPPQNH